jgi:hypothetical protein
MGILNITSKKEYMKPYLLTESKENLQDDCHFVQVKACIWLKFEYTGDRSRYFGRFLSVFLNYTLLVEDALEHLKLSLDFVLQQLSFFHVDNLN